MNQLHKMFARRAIFVVAMSWSIANFAPAQEWSQWRGPNRNATLQGFTIPKIWPTDPVEHWSVEVGLGDASPALAGDNLFVFTKQGTEEVMNCLLARNGEILWQEKQPAVNVSGGAAQHPGPRSTPTISAGKVYAVGVSGVLTCWNASSGKVLWRKDAKEFSKQWPMFFPSQSPVVVDGLCIAHLGTESDGAAIAYDATTGEEKWRWNGDGPSYGSPVVTNLGGVKQVVMETAKSLVSLAVADGKLLWQHPIKGQPSGTPIIDGNTIFYTAQGTHAVTVEKLADGFRVEPLWSRPTPAPRFTSPVLKDGYLYGCISTGNLFCIDAKTGEVTWTDTTRRGDPSAVIDAGPVLLSLGSNGEMVVFEPNPKEFKEWAKMKLANSAVWAYPILVGNRVYVKDKQMITMLVIE